MEKVRYNKTSKSILQFFGILGGRGESECPHVPFQLIFFWAKRTDIMFSDKKGCFGQINFGQTCAKRGALPFQEFGMIRPLGD